MSILQKFASAVLDLQPEPYKDFGSKYDVGDLIFVAAMVSAVGVLPAIGVTIAFPGEDGNQYADKIAGDYETVLEELIERKSAYVGNGSIIDPSQSYIMDALSADSNATSISEEQADKEWQEFLSLAKTFTDTIHRDPNIAEDDAGDILDEFEENVMPLIKLGYSNPVNSDALRECQAEHQDAVDINACSITKSGSELNDGLGGNLLAGMLITPLLFPVLPVLIDVAIGKNRKALENLKNGKKLGKTNW